MFLPADGGALAARLARRAALSTYVLLYGEVDSADERDHALFALMVGTKQSAATPNRPVNAACQLRLLAAAERSPLC